MNVAILRDSWARDHTGNKLCTKQRNPGRQNNNRTPSEAIQEQAELAFRQDTNSEDEH